MPPAAAKSDSAVAHSFQSGCDPAEQEFPLELVNYYDPLDAKRASATRKALIPLEPGVATTDFSPRAIRVGIRPARASDDLPHPDGPARTTRRLTSN